MNGDLISWEEKNLTDQLVNLLKNAGKDNFDTITEIKNVLTKNGVSDTDIQKKSGIYLIVNTVNGKYYVGSSFELNRRWNSHRRNLNSTTHVNEKLQRAWSKYGESNFEFIALETYLLNNRDVLYDIEQKYLDVCRLHRETNYNVNYDSRNPMKGNRHNSEVKEKIRKSMKGVNSGSKNFFFGKKFIHRMCGSENPNFGKQYDESRKLKTSDRNVYTFFNTTSGEYFVGTRREFYKRYNLVENKVHQLVRGERKSHHKWSIIPTQIVVDVSISENNDSFSTVSL
jgi:group I intron endonuclease